MSPADIMPAGGLAPPRNVADARYGLARLAELLADLQSNLRLAGMFGPDAEHLVDNARILAVQLRQVREEAAARVTTCASY